MACQLALLVVLGPLQWYSRRRLGAATGRPGSDKDVGPRPSGDDIWGVKSQSQRRFALHAQRSPVDIEQGFLFLHLGGFLLADADQLTQYSDIEPG